MKPNLEKRASIFSDVNYSFTVMLLGDSCTGKTCLLIRYKDGTFMNNNFISTVGIDYRNKLVEVDKYKVKLQIYDTAGQERFRSITSSYYRDADALLLIYDVTNRLSFENIRVRDRVGNVLAYVELCLQNWLAQVREHARENVQVLLVGNKTDLAAQRKVKLEEARQLAMTYGISYIEASAKNGHNVSEAFNELARRLVIAANSSTPEYDDNGSVIDLNRQSSYQSWYSSATCCS